MPICITCSTSVKHLYTTYSKADDRSLGKGVRLTQCPHCKRFADKYVEHDFVVLFIDLVLIKPQVYRHLLFNRLGRSDDKLDPSILRLGMPLLLFDVYLTWARVENSIPNGSNHSSSMSLSNAPILLQYVFFLTMNALATIVHHITVRLLVQILMATSSYHTQLQRSQTDRLENAERRSGHELNEHSSATGSKRDVGPGMASPSAISTALLVSSCTKLFPILLFIWPESSLNDSKELVLAQPFADRARRYVGWAVLLNNIEALLILLDCGYIKAAGLALLGIAARWAVEAAVLAVVGLQGESGPVGDIVGILKHAVSMLYAGN